MKKRDPIINRTALEINPKETIPINPARFQVGIIGGGQISEQHLIALTRLPNARVVGVCDLSKSLARFTAERFGVKHWFTDYSQMLRSIDCNVAHVLTPPASHKRIVQDCLVSGCDVLVEKPIALSHTDFLSLWQSAQQHGRRLIESQNYRLNTSIVRLREAVSSGRLGAVEEIEVRMCLPIRAGGRLADENMIHPSHRLPAGAIHEFITHFAYLFLEFLPNKSMQDIESIHAIWRNLGGGKVFRYDDLDVVVLAETIRGRIRFSAQQSPDCFLVHIRGSKGHAMAELFQPSFQLSCLRPVGKHLTPLMNSMASAMAMTRAGFGSIWRKIRNRTAYEGLHQFIAQTYQAWGNGTEPPVGFHEMEESIRFVDAMLNPENQI